MAFAKGCPSSQSSTHTHTHTHTNTHTCTHLLLFLLLLCLLHMNGTGHRRQIFTHTWLCCSPVWILFAVSYNYMHDEAVLHIQLPTVNTSIPALCSSAMCLSDVVHQACIVSFNIVTTILLTAPPVTQCLLLVDSLPPLLQLILLALLCDLHLLIQILSCCLLHTSWGAAHTSSRSQLSHHSTTSSYHQLSVCLHPACT